MVKIIINAISAKKTAGGAFQIAQNFMLKSLERKNIDWYYIASYDIDKAIGEHFLAIKGINYFPFPTQPDFRGTYNNVKKELKLLEEKIKPDLIYSITAPSYFKFRTKEVMRFTNPWVTHPNKYAWSTLSIGEKIFYYVYGLNQKRMMKSSRFFITQTETCKKGIMRITALPSDNIAVVNNVLPDIYSRVDNTPIRADNGMINVAAVGNTSPHKNFDIIPDVIKQLEILGYSNLCFHTTFPEDDLVTKKILDKAKKMHVEGKICNHGRLSQLELSEMYRMCQFCFLPTLLEVFSASTIEAMFFNLPIVATDFPFNSEVLGDSCLYYEPKNPQSAAKQFAKMIGNIELQNMFKEKMKKRLSLYGDYDSHFTQIESFLLQVAK